MISPSSSRHAGKSSGTISSAKTAKTAISEDAETQAIRRVNSRKNRRRLHRTISASDLIRDQARTLGAKPEGEAVLDVSSSSQTTVGRAGGLPTLNPPPFSVSERSTEENEVGSLEGSLRFMAGLLGTDVETLEPARVTGHDSWNLEVSSLQWAPPTHQLDAASIQSRGGYSLPTRTSNSSYHRENSDESASKGGFRFPIFSNDKGQCRHCSKLEVDLSVIREDLEYLRSLALRNEFVCSSCNAETPRQAESAVRIDPRSSDRLLDEVTARHKAQLEQLTKDRVSLRLHPLISWPLNMIRTNTCALQQRWQHDAQVKLQKYAGLCKDLNEEAMLRNNEVISLHKEMDLLRSERDQLAGELEAARATILEYEKDALERKKIDAKIQHYESKGLDEAEVAIKRRDAIIVDLSTRLEKALDLMELEREQQRQRRQIIFPTQRASVSGEQHDVATELKMTKDTLSDVQAELHALQLNSKKREAEWLSRIEALERQLNPAS